MRYKPTGEQAYRRASLQASKPTGEQAYRRASLQASKLLGPVNLNMGL
jgi:hypothetical protein